jgi:hypothetical protein
LVIEDVWDTVLLVAVEAGLGPQRIAAVVVIVSRSHPVRLMLAFFTGGFGMTLTVSAAILFVFSYAGRGQSRNPYPLIHIVAGLAALLFAGFVGCGLATRLVEWWHSPDNRATPSRHAEPRYASSPIRIQPDFVQRELRIVGFLVAAEHGVVGPGDNTQPLRTTRCR